LEPSGDEKEDTSGLSESEESDVEDEIESSGIAPDAQDQVQVQLCMLCGRYFFHSFYPLSNSNFIKTIFDPLFKGVRLLTFRSGYRGGESIQVRLLRIDNTY